MSPVNAPEGMVGVPKGEFEMGGVEEATLVYTETYYIDELEVTLKDYCETLQPPVRPSHGLQRGGDQAGPSRHHTEWQDGAGILCGQG